MTYPNLEEISDYLKLLGVDNTIDTSANRITFPKYTSVIQEILGKPLRIGLPDKRMLPDKEEFVKDVTFTWDLIKLLGNHYLVICPKYDIWEIHYDGRRNSRLS